MNQEQTTIAYERFMAEPREGRLKIFNEISAENRALLIKTHIERWLDANCSRLAPEQIAVLDETIAFIAPELYRADRDTEKVEREADAFCRKLESAFSREDMMQIANPNFAEYIPPVEDKN